MKLAMHSSVAASIAMLLGSGCTVYQAPPPQRVYAQPVPAVAHVEPAPQAVVSVYVEPPIAQPAPILVGWAPPPMLVETAVPMPFAGAVWVGGYWVWEGNWVWAAGHWMAPPQPNYAWVHPYYEHRDGGVVFITGHWSPPGVAFVPPPLGLSLTLVAPLPGIVPGPRPIGPQGVFVPPPPGSHVGLIVPAPIGTAPAVVTSAAPVVNVGMRIQNSNNTTINTRITSVTNITNVTIVAPASATANGKAFESAVPAQAHLAAAMPAVVRAYAPTPASAKPIPAVAPSHAPVAPPPSHTVPGTSQGTSAPPPNVQPPRAAAPERTGPARAPQSQPPAIEEDARARAQQERKARAEAARHLPDHARKDKKKVDDQKDEKREKKSD